MSMLMASCSQASGVPTSTVENAPSSIGFDATPHPVTIKAPPGRHFIHASVLRVNAVFEDGVIHSHPPDGELSEITWNEQGDYWPAPGEHNIVMVGYLLDGDAAKAPSHFQFSYDVVA